jgi:hypothetical protein
VGGPRGVTINGTYRGVINRRQYSEDYKHVDRALNSQDDGETSKQFNHQGPAIVTEMRNKY